MFKLFWTSPPKKRTTFSSWPFDQRFWAIKNLFAQKIWLSLFFSIFGKRMFVLQRFFACKIFRRFKSWITCHSNCKFSVKRPKWNAKISSFFIKQTRSNISHELKWEKNVAAHVSFSMSHIAYWLNRMKFNRSNFIWNSVRHLATQNMLTWIRNELRIHLDKPSHIILIHNPKRFQWRLRSDVPIPTDCSQWIPRTNWVISLLCPHENEILGMKCLWWKC